MLDWILWTILAVGGGAFIGWESYAHFVAKNQEAHTLSNRILALEKKHWWVRILIPAILIALCVHLEGVY
jgi:hypothetical protein